MDMFCTARIKSATKPCWLIIGLKGLVLKMSIKRPIKIFCYICLAALPCVLKKFIYNRFLGAQIDKTARIGFSYIDAKKFIMGANSKIGHMGVIRGLEELSLGKDAILGNFIRASAFLLNSNYFKNSPDRYPALKIGENSAITSRHYFDCNDTVEIGIFSTIAGLGSSFFTHGINIEKNMQETGKIIVGNYCMVSAHCVLIKGSMLPDCSVLGANSTLHKAFDEAYTLYSGVPAKPVKKFDTSCAYFHRKSGSVD